MVMTKCPRCGSQDIDKGRILSAGPIAYHSEIHKYVFKANCDSYCCLDCGYVETYVNEEYREKIKKGRK